MTTTEFTLSTPSQLALNAAMAETFGYAKHNVTLDAGLIADAANQQVVDHIDDEILTAINDHKAGKTPYLVIRGFKTDNFIGATPPNGDSSPNGSPRSIETLLGLHRACGMEPLSYAFENGGKLVRNVVPVAAASGQHSSHGADRPFPFHTDNPSGEPEPTNLSFMGMRNLERVPTEVLPLDEVIAVLSQSAKKLLCETRFCHHPPASNDKNAQPLLNAPVLTEHETGWQIRYDRQCTMPMTSSDAAAHAALAALNIAVLDAEMRGAVRSIILDAGDFLSFRNARVLHRRKAFKPHAEPAKRRWLMRIYGVENHVGLAHPSPENQPFVVV